MLRQSLRAMRPACARLSAVSARRTLFTPTAFRSADLVQDMYLRELKSYKPIPLKPTDSEGQVQTFSVPKPPPSPEEANLADASALSSYETQAVEIEGAASSESGAEPVLEDWFEEEQEEPAAAAH